MRHAHTEQARAYGAGSSCAMDLQPPRPSRELLRLLPMLQAAPDGGHTASLSASELQDLRERLAGSCEACLRTIHLGVAALGQLVARCSLDLQDGTIGNESLENLGFLMAELGDLASECMRIAAVCRSEEKKKAERPCAA